MHLVLADDAQSLLPLDQEHVSDKESDVMSNSGHLSKIACSNYSTKVRQGAVCLYHAVLEGPT